MESIRSTRGSAEPMWLVALGACSWLTGPELPRATWRVPPPDLAGTESVALQEFLVPVGPPGHAPSLDACQRGEDTRGAFPTSWAVLEVEPGEIRLSGEPVLALRGWAVPKDLSPLRDALLRQMRQRRDLGDLACWDEPHGRLLIVTDARAPAGLLVKVVSTAAQAERDEVFFLVSSEAPPRSAARGSLTPLCADQSMVELGMDGVSRLTTTPLFGDRISVGQAREGPVAVEEAVETLEAWVQPGEHPLDLIVLPDPQVPIGEVLALWSAGSGRLAPTRPVWATSLDDWAPGPAPDPIEAGYVSLPATRVPVVALRLPGLGTGCRGADGDWHQKALLAPIEAPR